jgi:hypothetical protein
MTDKHTIDQDATIVAQCLPMHPDPQESCPLCAFLRILAIAREAQGWKFAAEHEVTGGEPRARDAGEVNELLRFAAHGVDLARRTGGDHAAS